MKQITYEQTNPKLGYLKGTMRIIGKTLYFKSQGDNQYTTQILTQLQQKGAILEKSSSGWIKVDMFANQPSNIIKLGEKEFDLEETSEDEIENILFNFYKNNFEKANFKVTRG